MSGGQGRAGQGGGPRRGQRAWGGLSEGDRPCWSCLLLRLCPVSTAAPACPWAFPGDAAPFSLATVRCPCDCSYSGLKAVLLAELPKFPTRDAMC